MKEKKLLIHFLSCPDVSEIPFQMLMDSDEKGILKILDHKDRIVYINTNNALYWFFDEEEDK